MAPRTFPQILVFKEKHEDETYLISSQEEFHRIAVATIRERADIGYFGDVDTASIEADRDRAVKQLIKTSGIPAETAPLTVEALNGLIGSDSETDEERASKLFGVELSVFQAFPQTIREQSIQSAAKYIKELPRMISNYAALLDEARAIELIVKSERAEELTTEYRGRSYNLAAWILDSRNDYEYEGYELETPQTAPTAEELEAKRAK